MGGSKWARVLFGTYCLIAWLLFLANRAAARSVTAWINPFEKRWGNIAYGATVDMTCGGINCKHHLSLEHDTAFGYKTVANSIRPAGNGEQMVECVQGKWGYKSHFHTETVVQENFSAGTPAGNIGIPTYKNKTFTDDSQKVDIECFPWAYAPK